MRKSVSCMLAGLLTLSGWFVLLLGEAYDWHPGRPGLIAVMACFTSIVGIIWLLDEITDSPARSPGSQESPATARPSAARLLPWRRGPGKEVARLDPEHDLS